MDSLKSFTFWVHSHNLGIPIVVVIGFLVWIMIQDKEKNVHPGPLAGHLWKNVFPRRIFKGNRFSK